MNPKYANYLILANDFLEKNQLKKAQRAFEKSLHFARTKKEEVDSLFELADLSLQLEDPAGAQDLFRQILSLENHPGAYYGLAISGESLGQDKDQIIQNYQEAIRLDPSYTKAYFYLAHVYFDLKDYDQARDLFLRCLDLEPEDFVCYNDLGSLYEEQKDYQKARTYFLKSLDLCPSYARALYNMGVVENRLGRPRQALAYYEKSLEEYSHPYTYLNMSAIYFALQEDREAEKILKRGLTHHQDSVNLHYNLACAYVHLKDPARALEELKKAIKINPHARNWAGTDIDLKELVKEL